MKKKIFRLNQSYSKISQEIMNFLMMEQDQVNRSKSQFLYTIIKELLKLKDLMKKL